jgi:outer membrane protein OmpA-like peptidoglycan-associated protein
MSKTKLFPAIFCGILIWIGIALVPTSIAAQEGISIANFTPSTSVGSLFELTLTDTKDHLKWSAGGLLNYAHEPLYREFRRGGLEGTAYPAKLRLTADLYGALGLLGFMELGLALPIVAYQRGEGGVPNGDIQPAGLGDPRVEFKARFYEGNHLRLGAGAALSLPLGHYASSGTDLMGAKVPTFEPKFLMEGRMGRAILALNAGFIVRKPESIGNFDQTHAITWNGGFAFDIKDFQEPGGLRLGIEANGEANISFDPRSGIPVETLGGIKYRTGGDVVISAGAGPGLSRGAGTPVFRVFAGAAYDPILRNCPAGEEDIDGFQDDDRCIDPDNDQDGILDVDDDCINEAEDKDGFEDEDGCPETDNDNDKIPDIVDACPMIHEDMDNYEDDDGCPEEGPGKPTVKVTDTQLFVSSKVYFDFDKATIKEVSYPILDAVAEALLANPHIEKLRIDGHTDDEGTEEYNHALSESRAKAVMEYLIGKQIPAERLDYKGYGFSRPKASNQTEEGKAINRRVEFTIIHGD